MNMEALRILIRAKPRDGRLPVNNISRLFGGPGNGETCDACDAVITKEQLGIESISLVGRRRKTPSSSRWLFPDLGCGAAHQLA